MPEKKSNSILYLENILGETKVISNQKFIKTMLENTLGVVKHVEAIIYPESTEDIRKIIEVANKHFTPLYPISRGKNIGYGDIVPISDGNIIVDMSNMNKISRFDNTHGTVYIQPGVSQQQLNDFLKKNDSNFWMDVTGAGLDASIIGNALDGGFGHTPKGNKRETVTDLEVVLGNGTIVKTGTFPGLGPDLKGVFVQSNFGIVTGMKLELMPIPEHYESFVIKIKSENKFEILVDKISKLRQQNILSSLVHIANATRSLISTQTCPDGYEDKTLTCDDAIKIMSTPLVKVGYWTAIGGIYGTKKEVAVKKREIKRYLKFADIMFISDYKLKILIKIANLFKSLKDSVKTLEYIHCLGKGVPSNEAFDNIRWRTSNYEDMGLIWHSTTFPANGKEAYKITKIATALFNSYNFEIPITMTLISPNTIICIISISFNKNEKTQREKAYSLYNELDKIFIKARIKPYRKSIIGMEIKYDEGKTEILKNLKTSLDPNGIISPGRYGIK